MRGIGGWDGIFAWTGFSGWAGFYDWPAPFGLAPLYNICFKLDSKVISKIEKKIYI